MVNSRSRCCSALAAAPYSLSSFIGGVPVVCAGIAHADSRAHSPNENAILQNYYDGMRYIGALIDEFARLP